MKVNRWLDEVGENYYEDTEEIEALKALKAQVVEQQKKT